MTKPAFDTPIQEEDGVLRGPLRLPRQMLAKQEYGGHASIHDDATAQKLGFKGGTIEGPTHFSQFGPLGYALWGDRWFTEGYISVEYRAAAYEGEPVQAFMARPVDGQTQVEISLKREDGVEILRGTAGVGKGATTRIDAKLADLKPSGPRVILHDVEVGMRRPRVAVRMAPDTVMGLLYPFSITDKLEVITEPSPWFQGGDNPWGRAVLPVEMISVLAHHVATGDPWTVRGPTVDLFTDQEIRLVAGPVFVDEPYELEREVIALSGSRRTESVWVRTSIYRPGEDQPVAVMVLNNASLKDSYARYDEELAELA